MKALSIQQPFASQIISGEKDVEFRTWPTKYRGELLIVSSARPRVEGLLSGHALGTVSIVDCRRASAREIRKYHLGDDDVQALWCWILCDPKPLAKPFPVKGRLGLYEVQYPVQ